MTFVFLSSYATYVSLQFKVFVCYLPDVVRIVGEGHDLDHSLTSSFFHKAILLSSDRKIPERSFEAKWKQAQTSSEWLSFGLVYPFPLVPGFPSCRVPWFPVSPVSPFLVCCFVFVLVLVFIMVLVFVWPLIWSWSGLYLQIKTPLVAEWVRYKYETNKCSSLGKSPSIQNMKNIDPYLQEF